MVALLCAAALLAGCSEETQVVGTASATGTDSGADNGVLREPADTAMGQDSGQLGDSAAGADAADSSAAADGSPEPLPCVPSSPSDLCNGADDDCDGLTDSVACQDNNLFTADSCAGSAGCVFLPGPETCSDGNACTVGDSCAGGLCLGGAPAQCGDLNACTLESCDPQKGCFSANAAGRCDDGNACTSGDVCLAGGCQGGGPTNCEDGNPCTTDTCTAPGGCSHLPLADGVGCGGGKTCTAAVCGGGLSGGISSVIGGDYETCAIVGSGKILCWGDDKYGQVGSGATSGKWYYMPQAVAGLSGATQVDCGGNHCCAVTATGLFCWGNNEFGQVTAVGAPPTGTAQPIATPVKVLQPAVQVATGEYHTCAVDGGGTVRCWGLGSAGQLGEGNHTVGAAAVVTKVGASVKNLDCGKTFCCAVIQEGTVNCWGLNMQGQIGTGVTGTTAEATVPTAAKGVTGATAIASGDDHSCALVGGGKVICWGSNNAYQTGTSGPSTQATPALVAAFSGATAIAAGGDHTCALANGALYCWGSNGKMESAPGSTAIYVAVPTQVAGLTDPVSAGLGYHHTCARTASGALYCWGGNSLGQVGNGNSKDVKAPLLIP